jgi:hypothetical protein
MLEARCPKCGSKLVITSNDEGKEVMPIEQIAIEKQPQKLKPEQGRRYQTEEH